jgi:uncharacterized protein (TIGR00730 family)
MTSIRSLCVFTGSSIGTRPEYRDVARDLGTILGERGIRLVFGGGRVGLMGVIADATLAAGGEAIGVIPRCLQAREVAHDALTQLEIVETMHERKARMAELSDAFLAMPGGLGTCEELFEVLTWAQLGIHRKPCGLLNVAGYYFPLMAFLRRSMEEGFVPPEHRELILVDGDPAALLARFDGYDPPDFEEWMDARKS